MKHAFHEGGGRRDICIEGWAGRHTQTDRPHPVAGQIKNEIDVKEGGSVKTDFDIT